MKDHLMDQVIQTRGVESLLSPEEKPKKTKVPLEKLLDSVQRLGERKGAALYNILFRKAGWGIQWYVDARVPTYALGKPSHPMWKEGLVVFSYKRTLRAALLAERERLKQLPDVKREG